MIIGLFIYSLIFIAVGILFALRKKKLIAAMFFLLALLLAVVGVAAIVVYPHIWPF
ncbi:MAG TPA: hypothetical protein PLW31_05290 [Bacteroidales bacterium]|jgi:hypothetical protein|nr:hypothetical protein [Bacteroidales bacterium]MDX9907022.1 hypothetical protein [Bacteroidales bacterium]HNQ83701.1 hypothetical protein [Bacteroidales bacterium]HOX77436.1 hypothetical protein [Bacteroidales bacterium]HPI87317.1 hypothetical protein [Bacteroidales bacterium]